MTISMRKALSDFNKELKRVNEKYMLDPILFLTIHNTPLSSLETALTILDVMIKDIDDKVAKAYPDND